MSANLSNWLNEVLVSCPGASRELALSAITDAAIDYCARSWCWNAWITPMSAVANQPTYQFAPPTGAWVAERIESYYRGKQLTEKGPPDLQIIYPSGWSTVSGTPLYITGENTSSFRLVPYPAAAAASAITMRVAYQPTRDATSVPDELWESYRDDIGFGAKNRLMLIGEHTPYFNPKQAAIEGDKFDDAIASTRLSVIRGFGRARVRTRPHYF